MKSTTLFAAVLAAGAVASPVATIPPSPTELAAEAPRETTSAEATAATPAGPTSIGSTDDKIAGFRQMRGRPPPIHTSEHTRRSGPHVVGPRQSPAVVDNDKTERAREEAHRLHDKLMIATAGRLVAENKMPSEELAALDLEDADAVFTAVSTRLDRLTGSEIKRIFTEALARVEEAEKEDKKNKRTKKKQPYAAITNLAPTAAVPVPVPEPEPEAGDEAGAGAGTGAASSDGNVLEASADTPSGLPPMAPWVDNPSLLTNGEPADIYRGPSIPQNVDLPPAWPWKGRVGPFSATAGKQGRWYY